MSDRKIDGRIAEGSGCVMIAVAIVIVFQGPKIVEALTQWLLTK